MLRKYPLCNYCLGRQFARLAPGMSNRERGTSIKNALLLEAHQEATLGSEEASEKISILASNGGLQEAAMLAERLGLERTGRKPCHICGDSLGEEAFTAMAQKIGDQLREYEYSSFLLGGSVPITLREKEDAFRSEFSITTGEDIKNDVTREIGKILQRVTGADVDYTSPHITIVVNLFGMTFDIKPNPIFVKGRYLKHSRNIPQSVWHCRECWGRGCPRCNNTGREYPTSVSELVGVPAKEFAEAMDFKFHAAGREDVDALVEGTGRPFVLELKHPRKRRLALDRLERLINERAAGLVEVHGLEFTTRREVRNLKAFSPRTSKTYVAETEFDSEISADKLSELEQMFTNVVVEQRTPTRVMARRGDRLRHKTLYELKAELQAPDKVVFTIRAQGGLYVKELIDGDNGRTKPNVAELLGAKPLRMSLSVVAVETS